MSYQFDECCNNNIKEYKEFIFDANISNSTVNTEYFLFYAPSSAHGLLTRSIMTNYDSLYIAYPIIFKQNIRNIFISIVTDKPYTTDIIFTVNVYIITNPTLISGALKKSFSTTITLKANNVFANSLQQILPPIPVPAKSYVYVTYSANITNSTATTLLSNQQLIEVVLS